jgi:hypothetical protein
MRNNPLRYVDPSGRCAGDPNDPNNPDYDCWKQWARIQAEFRNVKLADARFWTLQQLTYVYKSLQMVLQAFGGLENFINALGNFVISRPQSSAYTQRLNANGITPPGMNVIFLFNSAFYDSTGNYLPENQIIFTIIHEIAHIFDFSGSGGNPDLYQSNFFVDYFSDTPCDTGWLGCLGDSSPYPAWLNFGGSSGGYNPRGSPTEYGKMGSIEDFADSFAVTTFIISGTTSPISVDDERITVISLIINLAGK